MSYVFCASDNTLRFSTYASLIFKISVLFNFNQVLLIYRVLEEMVGRMSTG